VPLELSISPQMHYSFPPLLYHCITGPHTTHCCLPHNTQSLAAHHTLPLAAASPPPFRLRCLVSLDHPHCLCLSKPQLCIVEAVSKRLCGFQRCKGLPTCYTAPSSRLLVPSSPQVWRQFVQMDDHHFCPGMPLNPVYNVIDPGDNVIGTLPASLQLG